MGETCFPKFLVAAPVCLSPRQSAAEGSLPRRRLEKRYLGCAVRIHGHRYRGAAPAGPTGGTPSFSAFSAFHRRSGHRASPDDIARLYGSPGHCWGLARTAWPAMVCGGGVGHGSSQWPKVGEYGRAVHILRPQRTVGLFSLRIARNPARRLPFAYNRVANSTTPERPGPVDRTQVRIGSDGL